MLAGIAKVSSNLGSGLSNVITQAGTTFSRMKKSDVAEALIATWCVEFLRVRKVGGFNVVEIVIISCLMLGVKTIIIEASRRRYSGNKNRTYVMSSGPSQMDTMGSEQHAPGASGWRSALDRRFKRVY